MPISTYWRDLGDPVVGSVAPPEYSSVAHLPMTLIRSMQDMERAIAALEDRIDGLERELDV